MPISAKHLNYFPFQCATCRETIQKHLGVTKEDMDLHMSNHHNGSNLFWNFWPKITEQCHNLPIQRTPLNNSTSTGNTMQNGLGLAQVKQENDNVIVTEEDSETVAKPNLEKLSQVFFSFTKHHPA
ncbi:hypothetical protein DdX_17613 [Ditylenchus destructor]|uniref:Uncharacterized protein n=1 Tax=Ditylenchus destructor TaxID=166010 RepID=A0AAD4MRN0_9BILA|nr:hypothetical protein DdX_17613 [Ditylenchus destructor]